MPEIQDQYIRKYLHLFRGMIAEVRSKQKLLQDRLRKCPEQVEEIKLQLGGLEGEMNALGITIEFIENWPASCSMVRNSKCSDCEHLMVCPVAKEQCGQVVTDPMVVVTSDGQIASNAPVTVIEVDVDEEVVSEDDVLTLDELSDKAQHLIGE